VGIFIDAADNLYVADQNNSRVQLYLPGSSSGITVAGGNGSGPSSNQISSPNSIFVDGKGNVFVSDATNNRVQEWFPGADSGITVAGGNGLGSAPNQLHGPKGVYVDTAGALYVSDFGNNRVQKYAHYYTIWKSYIPSVPGTYTALITDGAGCMATTNAIVISPLTSSIVSVGPSSATVCAGSPATFTALPQNGGTTPSYQWQVDGNPTGADNPVFTDSTLQNGDTVRCILTSSLTCAAPSASNSVPITVLPVPVVSAGNDTVIVPGASVPLDPFVSGSIMGYRWAPVQGLNDPLIAQPIASPAMTTAYQLTVTADDGCTASSKTTVYVYRQLHMPAAFTPNGDGKNDVFRIPPSTPQKLIAFSVYSRWGARVFSTQDGSAGWDGACNGEKQPAGTYVWVIVYYDPLAEKRLTARGTVLLIR
jgi:gliding motility-associated-like protein